MEGQNQPLKQITPSDSIQIHLHYLDHFMRVEENEELQSERRVKFFLALAIGTISLISVLSEYKLDDKKLLIVLLVAIILLSLLGSFVLASVIWSDRKIKQHRELWDLSYNNIKSIDPSVECYYSRLYQMDDSRILSPLGNFKGTLTQIIIFTESLLNAGIVIILSIYLKCELLNSIIVSIIIFFLSLFTLIAYAFYIKSGIKLKK